MVLDWAGIRSPCSLNNVLNSPELRLSFSAESAGSTFKSFSNLELMKFVRAIIGLNKKINPLRIHDDFSANFSGYTVAMVLGVISEKIKWNKKIKTKKNKTSICDFNRYKKKNSKIQN